MGGCVGGCVCGRYGCRGFWCRGSGCCIVFVVVVIVFGNDVCIFGSFGCVVFGVGGCMCVWYFLSCGCSGDFGICIGLCDGWCVVFFLVIEFYVWMMCGEIVVEVGFVV